MSRRGVGALFITIFVVLHVLPNVLAAVVASGGTFGNYHLFKDTNESLFVIPKYCFLIVGVAYCVLAEFGGKVEGKK